MMLNLKNSLRCALLFAACCYLFPYKATASNPKGNSSDNTSTSNPTNEVSTNNYEWCTGREYKYKYPGYLGTPYFNNIANLKGEVIFLGQKQTCDQVFLDIVEGKLVVTSLVDDDENIRLRHIALNNSWVERCKLYTDRDTNAFVYVQDSSGILKNGYYELLWDKQVRILISHQKEISQNASGSSLNQGFTYQRAIYVQDGESVKIIDGKRDFITYYKEHRKEIRHFFNLHRKPFTDFANWELIELFTLCKAI